MAAEMERYGFVRLHAREGEEAAVEEALREVMAASRAEAGWPVGGGGVWGGGWGGRGLAGGVMWVGGGGGGWEAPPLQGYAMAAEMERYGFVRLHAREGEEAAVEEALREVMAASRAEAG